MAPSAKSVVGLTLWTIVAIAMAAGCSSSPSAPGNDAGQADGLLTDWALGSDADVGTLASCGAASAVCEPIQVVTTFNQAALAFLSGTDIYYSVSANPGPILSSYSIAGGTGAVLFSGGGGTQLGSVAIDDANIYFVLETVAAKAAALQKIARGSSGSAVALDTTAPQPPQTAIGDIVVAGNEVFYSVNYTLVQGKPAAPAVGGLYAVTTAGGAPRKVIGAGAGHGLRVWGDYLCFSGEKVDGSSATTAIVRMPKSGGAIEMLGEGAAAPAAFEVNDSGIYWVANGLMKMSLGGSVPAAVFTPPPSTDPLTVLDSSFALDAAYAYLAINYFAVAAQPPLTGTELLRIPLDGARSNAIFQTRDNIDLRRIGVSGDFVYFALPATAPAMSAATVPAIAKVPRCGCVAH